MEARKKFIIIESQINLRETLIFSFESHFNVEAIRVESYEEAYDLLMHPEEIAFIWFGKSAVFDDVSRLYNAYVINRLNKFMPYYDFSGNHIDLICNDVKCAITIPRTTHIDLIISMMEKSFKIDYTIPKMDYTAISIESLSFLDEMKHCVYIKLGKGTGRYLKLFHQTDKITDIDVLKYKSKGVQWLYLQKDAYVWIHQQIAKQYQDILKDRNLKVKLKSNSIYLENDDLPKLDLTKMPLKIELNGFAISLDHEIIEALPERMTDVKNKLKKSLVMKDHVKNLLSNKKLENFVEIRTNLLIYFSCAIAKELEWKSQQIMDKLIYCAMTHDIILYNYPKVLIYDALNKVNDENLTPFERDLLLKHSELTLALVERDLQAPKEAYDIIAQHHEKHDGTGFPNKIDYKRINALSTVFNISLELANELMRNSKLDYKQYIVNKKKNSRGEAARKAYNALEKIINKNFV